MTINLFSPAYHKRELLQLIQNESSAVIMDMLHRQLDPEEARSLLLQKIDKLEKDKCTPLFFRNASLVKIIPYDICREIVEFNNLSDSYMVCRQFPQIVDAKRHKRCKDIPFDYPFRIQSAFSRTWNIPRYPQNDSLAIQMEHFNDGDTGLLKHGQYQAGSLKRGCRGASAKLIGTGDDVIITDLWRFKKNARSVLYFKNIRFSAGFVIKETNKVWFENCTFNEQLVAEYGSSLFARKCSFMQDDETSAGSLIHISGYHNDVQVVDCRFICGDDSDDVPMTSSTVSYLHSLGKTNISCNVFVRYGDRHWNDWMQGLEKNMRGRCAHSSTCNCVTIKDNVFI